MGRTGVEEVERRHHPTRKRADFRTVLLHENNCDASTESRAEERLRAHARSGSTFDWRDTNWSDCHRRRVKSLQTRIVKAWQEGRRRKAKALQRLLIRSLSGKALAVKRVTENQGKWTPGVDGAIWSTPDTKSEAVLSLGKRGYKPRPLRRVYIPKSSGRMRPLGIPTMRDRAMQALHLLALEPIAECTADPNSYGFRTKRSAQDAMMECQILFNRPRSAQWILEGDIRGCFDNISHDWLLTHVPMDKVILWKWLKAGFVSIKLSIASAEKSRAQRPDQVAIARSFPMQLKRRGVELRLIVGDHNRSAASVDLSLLKAVARAHRWFDEISTGRARSLAAIAAREGLAVRYVGRLIRLAFLAPEIVESIVEGRQPTTLTAEALTRRIELPLSWCAQRTALNVK
jgi:hypothetical protein